MARIAMITFSEFSVDARVRREAEALAMRGDHVDVISIRERRRPGKWVDGISVHGVRVPRYRGSSNLSYLAQYTAFFIAASFLMTWRHLRKPYDVIVVHTMPDFMVFTAMIPKALGAKVLLDVHDLLPELYQSKFQLRDAHRLIRFLRWIERRSVRFAHRAMAVSDPHLDALVGHGNPRDKFDVLLNVADARLFKPRTPRLPDERFNLIYHGTVAERHGLDVAVRAVALAREKVEAISFSIIGEGDHIPQLKELVAELGVGSCVRFDELVPLEQLGPIIEEADVGVVPIRLDSFTRYMLPLKLLEYVAVRLPVVCSDTKTIRSYFSDEMIAFFPAGDEHALAGRLVELYCRPELRASLAREADSFNHRYGWESQRQHYYSIVDSLLSNEGRH